MESARNILQMRKIQLEQWEKQKEQDNKLFEIKRAVDDSPHDIYASGK